VYTKFSRFVVFWAGSSISLAYLTASLVSRGLITTNCLAIRTIPMGSGITPTANPSPKPLMARRSSSQVRAGGTQRKTPLRAVVTILLGAPLEPSNHRDHGE
jgi:hypothetical protein